jgi:hypothetical integral membrane protein (TIGR02206 family)
MTEVFLVDNGQFRNYGLEHLLCFLATVLFIGIVLYLGKHKWNQEQRIRYITFLCLAGASTQLFKVFYRWQTGIFDVTQDVPLHLCNIMTLVMPFIFWYRWKAAWSMTFFWIMAGCAQSIFTPTLTESLPNYEAIRYWAVHAVIILGALYGSIVLGYTVTWRDALRSAIGLNVVAAILYPINIVLGANYMYLNAKPPGTTFYDLLGPWPGYIVALEGVIFVFFGLILLPFYLRQGPAGR